MRRRVVVVLAVVLVVAGLAPSAGGATALPDAEVDAGESAVLASVTAAQTNNSSTVRHEDPEEIDDRGGDLGAIRRQLAGRMGEITVDCSEGIRIGNYDACEELNGSYSDTLSKYVEVTGRETGGTANDSRSTDEFRELGSETRELSNETRRYRQVLEAYREARQAGNTAKARRLARELVDLGARIQRTGSNVTRTANDLSNSTGVSIASVVTNTRAVTANVTNTTAAVTDAVFITTRLSAVRADEGNVSAREPLVLTGRVQATNGSTAETGSVVLSTGAGPTAPVVERTRVDVGENGTYRLTYRPTVVPPGERTFSVRYRPSPTSAYLGTNTSVTASVEQVRVALSIRRVPETTGYDRSLGVTTSLRAVSSEESLFIGNVPLRLRLDGRTLGSGLTIETGVGQLRGRVPASVDAGEQAVTVTGIGGEQAVVVEPERRSVVVEPTPTTLAVRAVETAAGTRAVRVVGRLRARGGGVAGQSVAVRIDGRQVRTFETNATGHIRGVVTVPNASVPAGGREAVGLVAVFDGAGTNLESSRASQQVMLGRPVRDSSGAGTGQIVAVIQSNAVVVGGGAAGLLVLAGGAFLLFRRRGSDDVESVTSDSEDSSGGGGTAGGGSVDSIGVEAADAALADGGYTRAVLSAYAAMRRGLSVPDTASVTHWEFYRRAADAGLSASQLEALRDVTEAFERVSFAGRAPDEAEASTVLERVRAALSGSDGDEGGAAPADD